MAVGRYRRRSTARHVWRRFHQRLHQHDIDVEASSTTSRSQSRSIVGVAFEPAALRIDLQESVDRLASRPSFSVSASPIVGFRRPPSLSPSTRRPIPLPIRRRSTGDDRVPRRRAQTCCSNLRVSGCAGLDVEAQDAATDAASAARGRRQKDHRRCLMAPLRGTCRYPTASVLCFRGGNARRRPWRT